MSDNLPEEGRVLPALPPSELGRIDDLLTDDEKAELRSDLAAIHKTTHPEWATPYRERPRAERPDEGSDEEDE